MKEKGQMLRVASESLNWNTALHPPSDVTERSAIDQRLVLAKPCCGHGATVPTLSSGFGPKKGKTTGMPPRIAFLPSKTARLDVQSTSRPPGLR